MAAGIAIGLIGSYIAAMLRKRPDWSQRLPRPLLIPDIVTLKTLADVRALLEHVPKECHGRVAWQKAAAALAAAAFGVETPAAVALTVQMAFAMEGGACRPVKTESPPPTRYRAAAARR
jgi:hypothetical protein